MSTSASTRTSGATRTTSIGRHTPSWSMVRRRARATWPFRIVGNWRQGRTRHGPQRSDDTGRIADAKGGRIPGRSHLDRGRAWACADLRTIVLSDVEIEKLGRHPRRLGPRCAGGRAENRYSCCVPFDRSGHAGTRTGRRGVERSDRRLRLDTRATRCVRPTPSEGCAASVPSLVRRPPVRASSSQADKDGSKLPTARTNCRRTRQA